MLNPIKMLSESEGLICIDYSVVLVTYNRAQNLDACLQKIAEYNWGYLDFVVLDNNSSDNTRDVLSKWQQKLRLEVVYSQVNVGHGAGLGLAFEQILAARQIPKFILLLEDDSVPESDLPEILLNRMEDDRGFDLISCQGWRRKLGSRNRVFCNSLTDVDFCLLDGAMLRSDIILQLGLPECDWFMMVDDFEYCYRIKRAGFKIGASNRINHNAMHIRGTLRGG